MMKRLMLVITTVSMLLFTANAFAVIPTIDGTNAAGEWTTDLIINGFDVNEALIPDAYDISHIAMKSEFGGLAVDDGLYILIELYGGPTFATLDPFGVAPVFYNTGLDINKDGDFLDIVDRRIDLRASSGLTVFDGLGTLISPALAVGGPGVLEYFIPSGMFGGFPLSEFQTFTLLDNGGAPPDDQVPDIGFDSSVPEPGSMMLLGMGMFGLLATRIRRKKAA